MNGAADRRRRFLLVGGAMSTPPRRQPPTKEYTMRTLNTVLTALAGLGQNQDLSVNLKIEGTSK
ncbi:MAG: hypothetical protein ABIR94_18615 [Rubrivivax sp.]